VVTSEVDSDSGEGGWGGGAVWLVALPQPAASRPGSQQRDESGVVVHEDLRAFRAALASRTANEDLVAVVPGPGSVFSSSRTRPARSIT
jgi:hypothetical protein